MGISITSAGSEVSLIIYLGFNLDKWSLTN